MNAAQARSSYSHSLSVDEVVFRLARQAQVDAVLMMGSGASTILSPSSDIDLLVVLNGEPLAIFMVSTTIDQRLSEVYFMRAEELDVLLDRPKAVPDYSVAATRLRWIQSGQILFDRSTRLERSRAVLAGLAQSDWLIPPTDEDIYAAWYATNYDLVQTKRLFLSNDPVMAIKVDLRMLFMLDQLWQRYFLVRRIAGMSEKMRIRWMMKTHAPFMARFQACLAENDRLKKFTAYTELARSALEPVGGLWPEEMTAVQLVEGSDPRLAEKQLNLWESWLA